MRFRFTLQPVLEQRLTVEELRQRVFAQAHAAVEAARAEVRLVDEDLSARKDQIRQRQAGGMTLPMRRMYEDWIAAQTARRVQLNGRLQELEAKAEAERVKLVKAVQARIVMEKLREKELKAWRLEEARVELKEFDEIAVRNFANERRQEKNAGQAERISS